MRTVLIATWLVILGSGITSSPVQAESLSLPSAPALQQREDQPHPASAARPSKRVRPQGETGKSLAAETQKGSSPAAYSRWKRHLSFWPRKGMMLLELLAMICVGVLIAQTLEVSGAVKVLSIFTLPLTWMGKISRAAGPAFLMAFQSGAIANSMLVAQRDGGYLDNRELYTSVYVVSALSLFAHLPTFVVPLGIAFGWEATLALFGVRFAAIALQIILTLVVSRVVVSRLKIGQQRTVKEQITPIRSDRSSQGAFWATIWKRSRFTLLRLVFYLITTFIVMTTLEYYGAFEWLAAAMPRLFTFGFLPPQALVVIPAQALSLYNGAIAAANFIDSGSMTVHQAVIIILFGSIVTAPVRTLHHALPTYVAILGARPGLILAVSAQLIRMLFLFLCTAVLMSYWF
ncbi:MAG: nucleoside recognition protein [Desulfuromonadaceae bacterium]|nr:nucleoside recognition protein [Desulfuromonadaceae bacterium]